MVSWWAIARNCKNCCLVGNLLDLGIIDLLYRQFGAALGAAARKNEAPLVRSHAAAEAVNIATFDFFGLISALHDFCIITGEYEFVTVGPSYDILLVVEKLWIMTQWTSYLCGKRCLGN